MDRIEQNVLPDKSDPVEFRSSFLADFTMLSVTAAIIAQVAITALALQNLNQVHGTANACFYVSLVNACLSVWTSTTASRLLTSSDTPISLRDWLSNLLPKVKRVELEKSLAEKLSNIDGMPRSQWLEAKGIIQTFMKDNKWNRASFNSSFILTIPSLLLNYALATFFIGLTIYLGCVWKQNLNPIAGKSASLAVLICVIITVSLGIGFFFQASSMKDDESSFLREWIHTVDRTVESLGQAVAEGAAGAPPRTTETVNTNASAAEDSERRQETV